ncbi:MAG: hypothetical protein P8Y94_09150 [Acidobacteriota bacterium]
MDKTTIEQFREKLTQRRQRILEQLGRNEEDLAWLEQSRSPEFSEEAQEETAANSLKALDHQERREDPTTGASNLRSRAALLSSSRNSG